MPASSAKPFFLKAESGAGDQRYCLFHPAQGLNTLGSVLYLHPFAEEMNKSRRMAALQTRALAQAGFAVLQMDLFGCGDSSGDFGDATWEQWLADVGRGCRWLRERSTAPMWLWGLRAGCLLGAQAARELHGGPCNFLFWAPVAVGKTHLQQFLRLKAAADLTTGVTRGVTETLRQQLATGASVDVGGYRLSPELCSGLEQSQLAPPPVQSESGIAAGPRLEWFELSNREDAALSPVATKSLATWSEAGFTVRNHLVQGPSFWQTTEIEDAPTLIAATVKAMTSTPVVTFPVAV